MAGWWVWCAASSKASPTHVPRPVILSTYTHIYTRTYALRTPAGAPVRGRGDVLRAAPHPAQVAAVLCVGVRFGCCFVVERFGRSIDREEAVDPCLHTPHGSDHMLLRFHAPQGQKVVLLAHLAFIAHVSHDSSNQMVVAVAAAAGCSWDARRLAGMWWRRSQVAPITPN